MKHMHKLLCLLLALCTLVGIAIPALATDTPEANEENNLLPVWTPVEAGESHTNRLTAVEGEEEADALDAVEAVSSNDYSLSIPENGESTLGAWENFLKATEEFTKTQGQDAE